MRDLIRTLLMLDETNRPLIATVNLLEEHRKDLCGERLDYTPMYKAHLHQVWINNVVSALVECMGYMDISHRMRLVLARHPGVISINDMAQMTSELMQEEKVKSRSCEVM